MSKVEESQKILRALGLPAAQQNEMSALTLLALCNVKEADKWSDAIRQSLGVTKGIMSFVADAYGRNYAPNTRETFRRQVLHQFVQGRVADYNPDEPSLPVNSPKAHYAVSDVALSVIQKYGTAEWKSAVSNFKERFGTLTEVYEKERSMTLIPVTVEGEGIKLSAGKHNESRWQLLNSLHPALQAEQKYCIWETPQIKTFMLIKRALKK
jgi:hypothetical protein